MATSNSSPPSEKNLATSNSSPPSEETLVTSDSSPPSEETLVTSDSSPPSEETLVTSDSSPPSEETLVTSDNSPPGEEDKDYIAGLSRLTKQTANNIYEFMKLLYSEEAAKQFRREDLTPLQYCCMEDDSVTAAALIKAGANIDHVSKSDKLTALDLAAGCGSVKCVELLCDLSKRLPSMEELDNYISIASDEEQKLCIQQCKSILYQRMEALADKYAALLIEESETEKETKKKRSSKKKSSKHSSKSATNG